jgi:hypothetical protein
LPNYDEAEQRIEHCKANSLAEKAAAEEHLRDYVSNGKLDTEHNEFPKDIFTQWEPVSPSVKAECEVEARYQGREHER